MVDYLAMYDVERANDRAGLYWFEAGTMRFFRSRVGAYAYATKDGRYAYFVSSEQFSWDSPRLYTVRVQDRATGQIDTVGEFQQYASRSGADKRAQKLVQDYDARQKLYQVTYRPAHSVGEITETFSAESRAQALKLARRYRRSFGVGAAGSFAIVSCVQQDAAA